MLVKVKVSPSSRKEKVEEVEPGSFEISVKAGPFHGEANRRVMELLRVHFQVSAGNVRMIKGARSRNKIFDIKA